MKKALSHVKVLACFICIHKVTLHNFGRHKNKYNTSVLAYGHRTILQKRAGLDVLSLLTPEQCPSVCISWPQYEVISRTHAQALGMSNSNVWYILHSDLNLHPYKLQNMHSLSDRAKDICFKFCPQFQRIMTEDSDLPNNLLMTDEAHCHLHGTVNKQNLWYWSAANPYKFHQCPFMTQTLPFGVLFGPWESRDPTS